MPECPFCSLDPGRVVAETESAVAIRDAFPLAEGHTLVIPRQHVSSIYELSPEQQAGLWEFVSYIRLRLIGQYRIDSFNIGFNDGLDAGQTVPHAHIHIIPRRAGDVPDPRGGIRWIIADKAPYCDK